MLIGTTLLESSRLKVLSYLQQDSIGPFNGVVRARIEDEGKFLIDRLLLGTQDLGQLFQLILRQFSGLPLLVGDLKPHS
jgi:hypothetical protein